MHVLKDFLMKIRSYQPGDELAQARVYNVAAGSLPGFKPAKPEEITRRLHTGDADPKLMFYAAVNSEIVGYAVFGSNGRISFPWTLPGAELVQEPLLDHVVADMSRRGLPEAWATYRADWSPVLEFLHRHNFNRIRSMINYVAETSRFLALDRLPPTRLLTKLDRAALPHLAKLMPPNFGKFDAPTLGEFFWENPFYSFPTHLLALKDAESGDIRGVSLMVLDDRFADPTKIDSSMPCFRLGAFGTERQRHKRVNGLYSCLFEDELDADLLLAASLTAISGKSNVNHLAAQAPSDAPALCAWYDRHFERQGSFPILARKLTS
jgi:hypothetical protein